MRLPIGCAASGVALTAALPATDLFLMGREHEHSVPRGVAPVHRADRRAAPMARWRPTMCSIRSRHSAIAR